MNFDRRYHVHMIITEDYHNVSYVGTWFQLEHPIFTIKGERCYSTTNSCIGRAVALAERFNLAIQTRNVIRRQV